MIGKLTGRLDALSTSAVIVDVNGVGYEVTVPTRTLAALPPLGETVSLAIDTHLRDDAIRLYGFASEHERAWFRALQTVQGVGAKVALSVLGTLSAADLKPDWPAIRDRIFGIVRGRYVPSKRHHAETVGHIHLRCRDPDWTVFPGGMHERHVTAADIDLLDSCRRQAFIDQD